MASRSYPSQVIPENPTDANFEIDFRSNTENLMSAVKSIDTEQTAARGSLSSVASRLSVSLNSDGSLKTTAPTGSSWTEETQVASATGGQSIFTVTGDKTGIYEQHRALEIISSSTVYCHVTSSSYNSGTGTTTIGISAPIASGTVTKISFASQARSNLPADIGSGSSSSSSGGSTSSGSSGNVDIVSQVLSTTGLVDAFLYDTSLDSDTGDWISHSTWQSWYVESAKSALGTASRSTTKNFPRVVIITATTTHVRIYDATVNTLPLWMAISVGSGTNRSILGPETNNLISTVSAFNGYLYVGRTGTAGGLSVLDFINDTSQDISSNGVFDLDLNIEERQGIPVLTQVGTHVLNGNNVKSISTTVLSGTTTSTSRGMKDPELLVSTTNGMCIKRAETGAIIDLTKAGADDYINAEFLSDGDVIGVNQTQQSLDMFATYDIDSTSPNRTYSVLNSPGLVSYPSTSFTKEQVTVARNDDIYVAGPNGITIIREKQTDYTKGWSGYITPGYNTGWMVGDIRGCWLTDGDAVADGATDRSRKANNLTVAGSITSSNAATGAEMRTFSGYSANNYYHQATSTNLDFDQNTDFYICLWAYITTGGSNEETLVTRGKWDSTLNSGSGGYTGGGYKLVITATGEIEFQITNNGFATTDKITSTASFNNARWHQIIAFCDRSNGSLKLYIDGKSAATAISITNAQQTLVQADAVFHVGITAGATAALTNGYISLLKIGSASPTASEAYQWFKDEELMFTSNSSCTLPATSSNCTAIESDDITDIVTVSVADAIAQFNGFMRVYSDTSNVNYYSLYGLQVVDDNILYIDTSNAKLYVTLPAINLREELKSLKQAITATTTTTSGTGGTTGGTTSSAAAEVRFFGLKYDETTGMLQIEAGDGNVIANEYDSWFIAGGSSTFSFDTSGQLVLTVTGGTGAGTGSTITGLSGQPPSFAF